MKQCTKCLEVKPAEAFRKNLLMSSGLDSWCKRCANRSSEESRRKDMDKYRALERAKYARRMAKKRGEGYVVGDPANRSLRSFEVLDPEMAKKRRNVRRATRRALAQGKLQRLPCEVCGQVESEIHHVAYDSPLLVVWLCKEHHKAVHS